MSRLMIFLLTVLIGTPPSAGSSTVTRFAGQLLQPQSSGEAIVLREFRTVLVTDAEDTFFFVLDGAEGCPWPDAFGTATHPAGSGVVPHLLYRYQGTPYSIQLPPLKLNLPETLANAQSWKTGNWTWTVASNTSDDADSVKLSGKEQRGRRQQITTDRQGVLQTAKLDVFMGQGEKFQLLLNRTTEDQLPAEVAESQQRVQEQLLKLQSGLDRRADSQRRDLSARQIQLAQSALRDIGEVAQSVPVSQLVAGIREQLAVQASQMTSAESAKKELLGTKLPGFELTLLDGKNLKSTEMSGRPLVLHLWSYSQNAMEEPYGQVGYFEFLKTKASQRGVNFVGVITNPLVFDRDRHAVEVRSAKKVAEFMNLSYPIGFDDGSLKAHFDPAEAIKDESPLWIVVDASDKVIHYHQGFYEIDRRVGLKELAEAVDQALK